MTMTPDEQLKAALERWGLQDRPRVRLSGDVSPRQYHRLSMPDGTTAVAMVTPLDRLAQLHDWIAVGAWLAAQDVPVPTVLERDYSLGVLLIEDGGDALLTTVSDLAQSDDCYHRALDSLARLERVAAGQSKSTSPAHGRTLTKERMHWELRRFRKVVASAARDLNYDELWDWKEGEDAMVAALSAAPRVWMHRDLHARNLLITPDRAIWIDYQDAMMGPWLYDVASLLFDPYAALPEDRRQALLSYYLHSSRPPGAGLEAGPLWWLCAAQRLIHCVACYVFVAKHGGNDAYLRYMPFAIEHLRVALENCEQAEPLVELMRPRWPILADQWCSSE